MTTAGADPVVTTPIGPGAFVAVVGASGVGKDALIAYVRERTPDTVRYPRRTVTRPSGPGEEHDPVDEESFEAATGSGAFAVHWRAHGLGYGVPAVVDREVLAGRTVVVNVSRGVLRALADRYERLLVVRVTLSDVVRAERLRARGREVGDAVTARMDRPDPAPDQHVDVEIENDGPLERGGEALLRVVLGATR